MAPTETTLHEALRMARVAAANHMAVFDKAGETWREESVTDIILEKAYPHVRFAKFTQQQQEPRLGADWLWWWIDSSGEAFGMLVQAKRLKRLNSRWHIDFGYNKGAQRKNLVETGLALRVAPVYALYLGTSSWRNSAFCTAPEHKETCESCEKSTISMAAAITTTAAYGVETQEVSLALDAAMPLETLGDPAAGADSLVDVNLKDADPALRELLTTPQTGARRIAQLVFERVSEIRNLGYSGSAGTITARGSTPLFSNLPDDQGHFSRPYFPEILDGLRREAPDYVFDVLASLPVPNAISDRVAGIVIVQC